MNMRENKFSPSGDQPSLTDRVRELPGADSS